MDGELHGSTVVPTAAPLRATWTRLRSGGWGLRIDGAAATGDTVIAVRRDGSTEAHAVGRVVWTDGKSTLATSAGAVVATVAPGEPDPADEGAPVAIPPRTPHADRVRARKAGRSSRRYVSRPMRGRCEDAPCCGCCDAGGGWAF